MRASSRLVAQRIRAYERAHDPGAALRLLTVNPGSGELLAGALSSLSRPAELDDEESSEVLSMGPRRNEVIAYTDSWSYVSPVPRLLALQADLRHRESVASSTHLAPPLSLSVRDAESLMEDSSEAHLALLQDPGVAKSGPWHERRAQALLPRHARAAGDHKSGRERRPGVGERPVPWWRIWRLRTRVTPPCPPAGAGSA